MQRGRGTARGKGTARGANGESAGGARGSRGRASESAQQSRSRTPTGHRASARAAAAAAASAETDSSCVGFADIPLLGLQASDAEADAAEDEIFNDGSFVDSVFDASDRAGPWDGEDGADVLLQQQEDEDATGGDGKCLVCLSAPDRPCK